MLMVLLYFLGVPALVLADPTNPLRIENFAGLGGVALIVGLVQWAKRAFSTDESHAWIWPVLTLVLAMGGNIAIGVYLHADLGIAVVSGLVALLAASGVATQTQTFVRSYRAARTGRRQKDWIDKYPPIAGAAEERLVRIPVMSIGVAVEVIVIALAIIAFALHALTGEVAAALLIIAVAAHRLP